MAAQPPLTKQRAPPHSIAFSLRESATLDNHTWLKIKPETGGGISHRGTEMDTSSNLEDGVAEFIEARLL